jgi:hypothetical protein
LRFASSTPAAKSKPAPSKPKGAAPAIKLQNKVPKQNFKTKLQNKIQNKISKQNLKTKHDSKDPD